MTSVWCIGKGDQAPDCCTLVNVTSKGSDRLLQKLSPYNLGPVHIAPFAGDQTIVAANVENAWQYSKVYEEHTDAEGNPTEAFRVWAEQGWNSSANRFPMGRGARPLYSLHHGEHLPYVEARYRIYAPVYAAAVERYAPDALGKLVKLARTSSPENPLVMFDFDGYDHVCESLSLEQVLYSDRRMGHAFVLLMLIDNIMRGTPKPWMQLYDRTKIMPPP